MQNFQCSANYVYTVYFMYTYNSTDLLDFEPEETNNKVGKFEYVQKTSRNDP